MIWTGVPSRISGTGRPNFRRAQLRSHSSRLPSPMLDCAALMLAEVYQHTDREQQAIELLESLGSLVPDPIFALSLSDLYTERSAWQDVVRVSEGFQNTDDVACQLLFFRANALYELYLFDAALEAAKQAIRSRSRRPELLQLARYVRALAMRRSARRRWHERTWSGSTPKTLTPVTWANVSE